MVYLDRFRGRVAGWLRSSLADPERRVVALAAALVTAVIWMADIGLRLHHYPTGALLATLLTFLFAGWLIAVLARHKRTITALEGSELRFRQMAETIGQVFWMAPPDLSSMLYVSPAFERIWQLPCSDLYANPHAWLEAIHTEDLPAVSRALAALAQGEPYDIDFRIQRPDGSQRWINDRGYALEDDAGRVALTTGVATDITELRRAENLSRLSANAFKSIGDGIIVTDASRRIVSVNEAFTAITGYSPEEILGKTPKVLSSGRHDAEFYTTMWRQVDRTGRWKGEIWDRRKDGEIFPQLLSISAVKNRSGEVDHYVGVCTDISALKRYERQLRHQALHDALTGLPNRVLFQDRFRQTVARAQRQGRRVAVLFLDLDHFKRINDSLGHPVGDLLLQAAAERLAASVRRSDTVARFGGDEFAVLLDSLEDSRNAADVAQKLIATMDHPFEVGGHQLYASVSIGISCFPADGTECETLFKNADTAMYRAKAEGRNKYRFFSAEMNACALENLLMSNSLRTALENDELLLHYQPQYDLRSGRISGIEALVRWRHPELGLLPPARFVPLAEETGQIEALGEWVLRTACTQMRAWREANLPLERVAVNLSAAQFRHPDLSKRIADVLAESGLPPRHLEIEVTETMVMRNPARAAEILSRLKDKGITIAVDDFGTGYSSLSYLKRFPIDYLKIDCSFVSGLPDNADDAAIVKAIIAIAKSLKIKLLAEGVETASQHAFLCKHGCDEVQGFLFGRPVPAEEIERQLESLACRATAVPPVTPGASIRPFSTAPPRRRKADGTVRRKDLISSL